MEQLDIFGLMYEKKELKDIHLIELFAGYGSQALALKYLGVQFKHHKICEWAVKSIQAYNDLHIQDYTDYSKDIKDEDMANILFHKGISMDYNQPMTLEQIKRKGVQWQRKVYNNIIATHNLVDISRVQAKDLELEDGRDYICSYSFPCQDLSVAGLGAGMGRDSGTRSGLLWQVERILLECKELGTMPTVLLMENVPEVCGANNQQQFSEWCSQLTRLGYHNTMAILNAKDFGIPQNRRRCFMLSIYGEYAFIMPTEMKLEYTLKDLLEKNVPEKYYLSKQMIDYIYSDTNAGNYQRLKARESCDNLIEQGLAASITTHAGSRPTDNFIKEYANRRLNETLNANNNIEDGDFIDAYNKEVKKGLAVTISTRVDASNSTFIAETVRLGGLFDNEKGTHQAGSIYSPNGTALALDTATGGHRTPLVVDQKEDTFVAEKMKTFVKENGYMPDMFNPYNCNEIKDVAPTQTAQCGSSTRSSAILVVDNLKQNLCNNLIEKGLVKENDVIRHSYTTSRANGEMKDIQQNNMSPTLDTRCDCLGVVVKNNYSNLRIRKLTPRECFRLMGVKDEDSDKIKQSDASLYHLAGDSIVTTCLMAIFGKLLNVDYESKIKELVREIAQ